MLSKDECETVGSIINKHIVDMSLTYAKEYKENPKNFLSTYHKNKSIRTTASFIVSTYKQIGAYEPKKDFTQYAEKYYSGEDSRVFAEFLSIIHSIITE